jgi:hypothetical protein
MKGDYPCIVRPRWLRTGKLEKVAYNKIIDLFSTVLFAMQDIHDKEKEPCKI